MPKVNTLFISFKDKLCNTLYERDIYYEVTATEPGYCIEVFCEEEELESILKTLRRKEM